MDRNPFDPPAVEAAQESLSARRAWIEMMLRAHDTLRHAVALRKESVDRNQQFRLARDRHQGRSPQGERG